PVLGGDPELRLEDVSSRWISARLAGVPISPFAETLEQGSAVTDRPASRSVDASSSAAPRRIRRRRVWYALTKGLALLAGAGGVFAGARGSKAPGGANGSADPAHPQIRVEPSTPMTAPASAPEDGRGLVAPTAHAAPVVIPRSTAPKTRHTLSVSPR